MQNATRFQTYLHYPGQFIRYKDNPVAETIFNVKDNSQEIILTIPDITTLRKRSRPSQPCEDTDEDKNCAQSYVPLLILSQRASSMCLSSRIWGKVKLRHSQIANRSFQCTPKRKLVWFLICRQDWVKMMFLFRSKKVPYSKTIQRKANGCYRKVDDNDFYPSANNVDRRVVIMSY